MPQPEVTNTTPFAVKELYLADEESRDLLVVLVKATYRIVRGTSLVLDEEQVPVNPAGVHHGDPAVSSLRFEPEVAPLKLATDVILIGHAHAGRRAVHELHVGFQVGPVQKMIRVLGNRWWYRGVGGAAISSPEPFELMPLVYERAFGGWDRTSPDPDRHSVDLRNPVGVGYHHPKRGEFVQGLPLPNLELPQDPIQGYHDAPAPAGFGFIGPSWVPRVHHAGTFDDAWVQNRMPLLPKDFDRRYFNAAPADQIAPGYLRGDEPVRIANASPEGMLEFMLPGEPPPVCSIRFRDATTQSLVAPLDTVILDTDAGQVVLLWRACFLIPGRLYQVRGIAVQPSPVSQHAQVRSVVASAPLR